MNLLNEYMNDGTISLTPSQDYDDSYCIHYARMKDGYVVTNDMYNDYIGKLRKGEELEGKEWLAKHLISFTFVGTEFFPNPDFRFKE